MSKSGIVNVRMVITEEKILSNIDKVQKLINPKSKKKIVQLEENSNFKDLIDSIKTYLIEYPKKKNFPVNVYRATYGLVEYATTQFEENTKKIEGLIKQREENIVLSQELKETIQAVDNKDEDWEEKVKQISSKISEDIVESLNILAKCEEEDKEESQEYKDAMKLLNARVNNLESNLHIEIDMERLEDCSKALSFIGIEIAEAMKLIPTPEEQIEAIEQQEEAKQVEKAKNVVKKSNVVAEEEKKVETIENTLEDEKEAYIEETTFEAKQGLWQRIKSSKLFRAATYVFRIKVRIELPSNALPEGNQENV